MGFIYFGQCGYKNLKNIKLQRNKALRGIIQAFVYEQHKAQSKRASVGIMRWGVEMIARTTSPIRLLFLQNLGLRSSY